MINAYSYTQVSHVTAANSYQVEENMNGMIGVGGVLHSMALKVVLTF